LLSLTIYCSSFHQPGQSHHYVQRDIYYEFFNLAKFWNRLFRPLIRLRTSFVHRPSKGVFPPVGVTDFGLANFVDLTKIRKELKSPYKW
jgi:hypothetical protein